MKSSPALSLFRFIAFAVLVFGVVNTTSLSQENASGTPKVDAGGTITNRGKVPVATPAWAGTVKGRYWHAVNAVIGTAWHELVMKGTKADPVNADCFTKVEFTVDKLGKVCDFKFLQKSADSRADQWAAAAVQTSTLPAPPAELIERKTGKTGANALMFTFFGASQL